MRNVFYFSHINVIGGIEQFFAYLSEKYVDWDITIIYKTGDSKQIARLRKYVRVEKFNGQEIECDKAFFNSNFDIKSYVKSKEYNLVIHGDFKTILENENIPPNHPIFTESFDNYYGVSQVACDGWTAVTGKPCKLVYNPFIQQPQKKILKLVYCGRLTYEKGGELVSQLIERLNKRNIDYMLYVYSDKTTISGDNVIYMGTRLDAGQFLTPSNFDYILVLSKHESYCYSLVQALANGLPAVTTPCPVFKEIGADKTNSIVLNFDGSNMDSVIDDMINTTFDFTYKPKKDTWADILASGKTTYQFHTVAIKALEDYYDIDLNMNISKGTVYETSADRAKLITEKGYAILVNGEI